MRSLQPSRRRAGWGREWVGRLRTLLVCGGWRPSRFLCGHVRQCRDLGGGRDCGRQRGMRVLSCVVCSARLRQGAILRSRHQLRLAHSWLAPGRWGAEGGEGAASHGGFTCWCRCRVTQRGLAIGRRCRTGGISWHARCVRDGRGRDRWSLLSRCLAGPRVTYCGKTFLVGLGGSGGGRQGRRRLLGCCRRLGVTGALSGRSKPPQDSCRDAAQGGCGSRLVSGRCCLSRA